MPPVSPSTAPSLEFVDDFLEGMASYPIGVGVAFTHQAAGAGLLGVDLKRHADQVDAVLAVGVGALSLVPVDVAAREAVKSALQKPGFVLGRFGVGVAVSGTVGPVVGLGTSVAAGQGSLILLGQKGAGAVEFLRGAIFGF
jgi:hypothetical protein